MAEIIRTENLQYAYPADEGAEPVLALKLSLIHISEPTRPY